MAREDEFDKKIEEQNKKITHVIWIIFVSMITALITTLWRRLRQILRRLSKRRTRMSKEKNEVKQWIHAINMSTAALRRQASMRAIAQEGEVSV